MHKLRLAIVLPIIQVVIAAILLRLGKRPPVAMFVPTAQRINWGLNAPALLFRAVPVFVAGREPASTWPSRSVLGFDVSDLFFLVGVIVVWFLVGRALDRRRTSKTAGGHRSATALVAHPLLLALAGLLFYLGLLERRSYLDLVRTLLMWIWSASLIFVSIRGLVRVLRHPTATNQTAKIRA